MNSPKLTGQSQQTQQLNCKSSPATRHGGAWGGERRYSSYSFSTSPLDGGEWSASRPGRAFTPGERTPGTHCTGGWVGLRAGLDTEARGDRGSNPDRPVVQPVVRHYTAWANPARNLTVHVFIFLLLLIYLNCSQYVSQKIFNIITVSKTPQYFKVCYSLMMIQWGRNASEHN
jgi:hypothetical protein